MCLVLSPSFVNTKKIDLLRMSGYWFAFPLSRRNGLNRKVRK